MKKLMIVAAAAAMTFAANAGLQWQVCENCGVGPEEGECDLVVFKVTGSGKAVTPKGDYKTVGKLKIKKGALALSGSLCESTGDCCYEAGRLFATVKAGKNTFGILAEVEVAAWSIFGKKLDKARAWESSIKKGKKVKLESALFISSADAFELAAGDSADLETLSFWASAFGKVTFKVRGDKKGSNSYCGPEDKPCEPIITPKDYKGWFVGLYNCVGEENCFLCDCTDTDVFGGTWKAKYQAKAVTTTAALKLAGLSAADFESLSE